MVALSFSLAGTPAIKVTEQSSRGEAKNIGSLDANDNATRVEILKLWKEAKKAFPKDRRDLLGPDSGYVEITITNGEETIVVRSWHPLFEKNEKLVVTSNGVEALDGRSRKEVLKADKEWYREARRVFDEVVNFAKSKAVQ